LLFFQKLALAEVLSREKRRFRSYGLTPAKYDKLFIKQGGKCALCRMTPQEGLHVDHDHNTGKIRGLLCRKCNTGLGKLGDTAESVQRAVKYLQGA
jgi:hypothetical protein